MGCPLKEYGHTYAMIIDAGDELGNVLWVSELRLKYSEVVHL